MSWPKPSPAQGANFMGWGGPARGNAATPPAPRTAADAKASSAIARDPVKMAEIEAKKRSKEERAEALLEFRERIALDEEFARQCMDTPGLLQLRLSAAVSAENRLLGTPTASISGKDGGPIEVNLTRERLADRIARLAAGTVAIEGASEPDETRT
jgi:hypothetical protein